MTLKTNWIKNDDSAIFPRLTRMVLYLMELEFWLVDRFRASLPLYELWPKSVAPRIIHNSDILNASTYFFLFPSNFTISEL